MAGALMMPFEFPECGLQHETLIRCRALPSPPHKALEMSQFTVIHKDPKQIRRNQFR